MSRTEDYFKKLYVVTGAQLNALVQAGHNANTGDNVADSDAWKAATTKELDNDWEDNLMFLCALERAGVDNWEGYGEAREIFTEMKEDMK